jgi:hypothetical protein
MATYTGRVGFTITQRIKLTYLFYVLRVRQWFTILRSQADASRVADLGHLEWSHPTGGELVGTLLSEDSPEH